jgi:hypothetical protein
MEAPSVYLDVDLLRAKSVVTSVFADSFFFNLGDVIIQSFYFSPPLYGNIYSTNSHFQTSLLNFCISFLHYL